MEWRPKTRLWLALGAAMFVTIPLGLPSEPTSVESSRQQDEIPEPPTREPLAGTPVRTDAANVLGKAIDSGKYPRAGGVALEPKTRTVLLFWKGSPPKAIRALIQRLREEGQGVKVVKVPYSRIEVTAEVRRLMEVWTGQDAEIRLTMIGPLGDWTGILIGVLPEDLERAKKLINSSMPLRIEASGPFIPLEAS